METSRDRDQQRSRRREEEEWYCLGSPCYFCQKVVKALLKCLGHDDPTPVDEQANRHQPSGAETGMKSDEVVAVLSTKSVKLARRPPRPPPLSSGRGGQIN